MFQVGLDYRIRDDHNHPAPQLTQLEVGVLETLIEDSYGVIRGTSAVPIGN